MRSKKRTGPRESRRSDKLLAVALDDAAAREVVGRQLDPDAIARRDAYEVAAHAAGGVGDELVAAFELDLEHRIGQRLRDDRVHHDGLLFLAAIVLLRLGRFRRAPRTPALALGLSPDSWRLVGPGGGGGAAPGRRRHLRLPQGDRGEARGMARPSPRRAGR